VVSPCCIYTTCGT